MIGINQNNWGSVLEDQIINELDGTSRANPDFNPDKVNGFFSKKGAVEVILFLGDGPKPFETLNDLMTVSRSTVSNRVTEASKIGLVSEETIYLPDEKVRPYRLSIVGRFCVDIANEVGVSEAFEEWYDSRKTYRNKLLEFNDGLDDVFDEHDREKVPEIQELFKRHIKDTAGRTVDLDL